MLETIKKDSPFIEEYSFVFGVKIQSLVKSTLEVMIMLEVFTLTSFPGSQASRALEHVLLRTREAWE